MGVMGINSIINYFEEVEDMKKCMVLGIAILCILGGFPSLGAAWVPLVPDLPGWDREIPQGDYLAQFSLPGEDDEERAVFFVYTLSYAGEGEAREFEERLKEVSLNEGDVTVLEVKEDIYRGRPWVVHDLLVKVPGEEGEDPEMYQVQKFYTRDAAKVHVFEFVTYPRLFQELVPSFLECMERITFQEEPAAETPQAPPISPVSPASPAQPGGGLGVPQGLGALGAPQPTPVPPARLALELSPSPEWSPAPPLDPSISRYYLLIQQGVNMAEMLLFEEDFSLATTLESYSRTIESQVPQLFENYQACQSWNTTINGVSMRVHEFFFSTSGNPHRLMGRAYIFLGGPLRGYVVLFDTTDQSYPSLAPKFDAVMRTLRLEAPPESSPQPPQKPEEFLPPLPDAPGLPSFGDSSDPGIYEDPSKGLRVNLPGGAKLLESFPQGGRYALADGVELVLLNLGSSQEVENMAAQAVQGKSFQGESHIQARGITGQVGLYASVHPQTSLPYATLLARYPRASLLMIFTLPRANYQKAGSWILPFLESVSLGR
jgi:hypothetical protein